MAPVFDRSVEKHQRTTFSIHSVPSYSLSLFSVINSEEIVLEIVRFDLHRIFLSFDPNGTLYATYLEYSGSI